MHISLKNGFLSLMLFNLVACSGGGGASPSAQAETSDITVIETTPQFFASDVERDAQISARFDGDVLAASVDTNSFQLHKNGKPVQGSVNLLFIDMVGFTPDQDLDLLSIYRPTITEDLHDIDGRPLADDFQWGFVTRDGIWRGQTSYSVDAVDQPLTISTGNTIWAFHLQNNQDSGQADFFATRLRADDSWDNSSLISNGNSDGNVIGSLSVNVLSNGGLLAVWQETADDGTDEIWYNRYDQVLDSWGESARITFNNFDRREPKIISNGSDNIFVQFELEDSISMATDVMVIGYSVADDQWLDEQLVANDFGVGEGQPSIAMDNAGNMMAIWFDNNRVRSRYYNMATQSWEDIELIDLADAEDTQFGTQIVVDSWDNFTAVWAQLDSAGFPVIWANRFTPGQGWGEAQAIEGSIFGLAPVMRVNKDDNIMLIWLQQPVIGNVNIWFSGFNIEENAWTSAELLEQGEPRASQHQLVVDESGNFMAMWKQDRSGTFFDLLGNVFIDPPTIWVRRFDNTSDGEWLAPTAISSLGGSVDKPTLAANSNGEIMALWMQIINAEPTIQSRYFD